MIYKYFKFSTDDASIALLDAIANKNTIRASEPRSFNDPFEFKCVFAFDATIDELKYKYYSDNPSKTEEEFDNWIRSLNKHYEWYVRTVIRGNLLKNLGVICFSKSWNNHLLWSHYALDHTGFCIGFDENELCKSIKNNVFAPIVYSKTIPVYNHFKDTDQDMVQYSCFYKSDCWAYEEEMRMITPQSGIFNFSQQAIKEIILGCRSPSKLRQFTLDAFEDTELELFQAFDLPLKYSIDRRIVDRKTIFQTSEF